MQSVLELVGDNAVVAVLVPSTGWSGCLHRQVGSLKGLHKSRVHNFIPVKLLADTICAGAFYTICIYSGVSRDKGHTVKELAILKWGERQGKSGGNHDD